MPLANRLVDLTGGSQGVAVVATTAPEWTGQADDQWRLYLVGVVAAVVFWVVHNLLDGRLGRALAAIRVNEAMAAANGVSRCTATRCWRSPSPGSAAGSPAGST